MGSKFTFVITLKIMMIYFEMFDFLTVVTVYIFITEQRNCFIYDIELAAEA